MKRGKLKGRKKSNLQLRRSMTKRGGGYICHPREKREKGTAKEMKHHVEPGLLLLQEALV